MTPELLNRFFTYCPISGIFRWKESPVPQVRVGDVAGSKFSGFGYVQLKCRGKTILAQRAAFYFMTGRLPSFIVDHKNGITNDNRWENLRPATRVLNTANSRKRRDGVSPFKGVTRVTGSDKWQAAITVDKKRHYLGGTFLTAAAAHEAYKAAARAHFGEFARFD